MVELVAQKRNRDDNSGFDAETDMAFARLLRQCHRAARAHASAAEPANQHNDILRVRTQRDHRAARDAVETFLGRLQSSS